MALGKIKLSEDKVKIVMAREGFSQKDLAEAIGVTSQRLGTMFKTSVVLTSNAGRIAKALNVDVTEIID
jgi:DNA-binding Xre family transcriptional regulator